MSVRTISSLLKNANLNNSNKLSNDNKCYCNEGCFFINKIIKNDDKIQHINIYKCNRLNIEKIDDNIEKIENKKDKLQIKQFVSSVVSKKPCDYYKEIIIKSYEPMIQEKQIMEKNSLKLEPKQLYFDDLINDIISAIETKTYPLNHYTGRLNNYLNSL